MGVNLLTDIRLIKMTFLAPIREQRCLIWGQLTQIVNWRHRVWWHKEVTSKASWISFPSTKLNCECKLRCFGRLMNMWRINADWIDELSTQRPGEMLLPSVWPELSSGLSYRYSTTSTVFLSTHVEDSGLLKSFGGKTNTLPLLYLIILDLEIVIQ